MTRPGRSAGAAHRIAELEREVARLRHLLTQQVRHADLWMESGVNPRGEAFVTLRWGDMAGQFTTQQGRDYAADLFDCAAAADWDAAWVRFAVDGERPMSHDQAVRFLGLLRKYRGSHSHASTEHHVDA
jgi:hypothetical protein